MTETSMDRIVARASEALPLPRNDSWQPGLALFLRDLDKSTTLLPGARDGIEGFAAQSLRARFAIDDWLERHPEALAAPVTRPLFIMGMPRAGTTLLLNLLRFDPARRVFWHWEGNNELPPAETAHLHDDPRIVRKVAEVNAMLDSGALPRNHHVELGDEPTECNWLLGQDFKAYPWLVQTQVTDYFEWMVHEADMVAAYTHHKRALQLMQSKAPGGWTLKFPSHAMALDAILKVYPDARIILTHRDPIKPVGSSCSLCDQILTLQNSSVDKAALGYQTAKLNALGAERMSAARDANPQVPFMDIHYRPFVRDPLATVRQIYAFIGMELTAPVEAQMQAALDRHNANRTEAGEHRYTLEEYGLSEAGLDRMFGDYIDRYQIELERK